MSLPRRFVAMAVKFVTLCLVSLTWLYFALFARDLSSCECPALQQQRPLEDRSETAEELFVFNNTGDLAMNDSRLLNYIRDHYIEHPKPIPYNLEHPLEDPSKEEGQNRIVLDLLKNKTHGIYIEAGANDGEYLSTTLALERDFGWTGLLVEPDRTAFEKLQKKNRRAWLAPVCLSPIKRPTKVEFLLNRKHSVLSKLANIGMTHRWWTKFTVPTQVACFPLYSLLMALEMTEIDYFSLDIEGAELNILKTIPFGALTIRVMSVEYNLVRLIPGADQELKRLMEFNRFYLVKEIARGNAQDYIFAHASVLNGSRAE